MLQVANISFKSKSQGLHTRAYYGIKSTKLRQTRLQCTISDSYMARAFLVCQPMWEVTLASLSHILTWLEALILLKWYHQKLDVHQQNLVSPQKTWKPWKIAKDSCSINGNKYIFIKLNFWQTLWITNRHDICYPWNSHVVPTGTNEYTSKLSFFTSSSMSTQSILNTYWIQNLGCASKKLQHTQDTSKKLLCTLGTSKKHSWSFLFHCASQANVLPESA